MCFLSDSTKVQAYLKTIDEVIQKGPFKDDWESLSHYGIPDWYARAKFGLFVHWGVYSVPAFHNEWYSREMYQKGSRTYAHHRKTYDRDFGYKDFIPQFKAEHYNPKEWAELFAESGARYVTPVGEHHDGFKMYPSELCEWNAVNMGPKRDVYGELKKELTDRGIKYCSSSHRAEHYWFMNGGRNIPGSDVQDERYREFYGPSVAKSKGDPSRRPEGSIVPSQAWLEDWLASTCELVDVNRPYTIYFDWWVRQHAFRPYMKKFLAYYYNRSREWGMEVCVFYKWDGVMYHCAVLDIERGQLAAINPRPWQNDTAIAKNSWGYTQGNDFKTPYELICNLIDVVSKNGCLMLNVGPKADGTICPEEAAVLREIGKWLQINGEAIYDTSPYKIFGEGPSNCGGSFHEKFSFTKKDFRFTYKPDALYVFALMPNQKNIYRLKTLGSKDDALNYQILGVSLLGRNCNVSFTQTNDYLELHAATDERFEMPVCFKISID